MDVSCNLTTFKFFVRVPPGLYCHPIERAYCQVKPERIETHTGGAPGAGSGLRGLLRPGGPRPSPEGAGRERGSGCLQSPGRDNRHRFLQEPPPPQKHPRPRRSSARGWEWGSTGPGYPPGSGSFAPPRRLPPCLQLPCSGTTAAGRRATYLGCPPCRQPPSLAGSPFIPKRRVPSPSFPSHPRPLHLGAGSRLSPLALSIVLFPSSGARLPSRKREGCKGAAFSFPFSSPPSQLGKRGASWKKGVRAAGKCYFRRKKKKKSWKSGAGHGFPRKPVRHL